MNLKKNPLITGTLLLTAAGLISRGIGFLYRLFISRAFGEESMGLFQLISPVIMIAFSLTAAGMQTTISRYTASCIARGKVELAHRYLRTGSIVCVLMASCYALFIYGQADFLASEIFKESRLTPLLQITAFTFPLSALHCCLNGYFYGTKEVRIPSLAQLVEQFVRTGSVFLLYFLLSPYGQPTIVLAAWGMLLGELISCAITYFAYRINNHSTFLLRNPIKTFASSFSLLPGLLGMALPLSFNRLIVNILQSLEAIAIPQGLKAYGYSSQTALSIYGVLTGMAFSLVLFPAAFTNSASVLLLPAVTEAASSSSTERMKRTIWRSILVSTALGILCGAGFFILGDWAGKFLFDSILAGTFIRQLSFLCPFLYLHGTLSSVLNGLKKTCWSLIISVSTLLIRLGFTIFLLPHVGIIGYLWGLLISELLSTAFCIVVIKRSFP